MQWSVTDLTGNPSSVRSDDERRFYAAMLGSGIQAFLNNTDINAPANRHGCFAIVSYRAGDYKMIWPTGHIPFDQEVFYGR